MNKNVEDVLLPPVADLACYETAIVQTVSDSGFVFGSNLYGDILTAQRIVNPHSSNYRITSVAVAFEFPGEGADDIYLNAFVLSDGGSDLSGSFTVLGESDSVRAADLQVDADDVLYTTFTFSEPVVMTNDSFFIGIDFSRAYDNSPPPFIGLLSTEDGCGDGSNVVIVTRVGLSETINTLRNIYGLNSELYFEVTVDDSLTTGILTPRLADYGIESFPNPALDEYSIRFTGRSAAALYTARLTDLSGRLLREARPATTGGVQYQVDWSLADLPAGLYLYHIDGPEGRQSGKVMKR